MLWKILRTSFLLNNLPLKVFFIGDNLISNISRWQEVWSEYFSKYSTLNVGIPENKIQNVSWWIENLKFPSNLSLSCIFIVCGANNIDHNSPEEIINIQCTSVPSKSRDFVIANVSPRPSSSIEPSNFASQCCSKS